MRNDKDTDPLEEWRLYFQYDPDLDPWKGLSTLVELRERLEAALNYLQGLADGDRADKQFGVDVASLAFNYVDQVYQHLDAGHQPLSHRPRTLALAVHALRNLLADVQEKVLVRQMAVGGTDNVEPAKDLGLLGSTEKSATSPKVEPSAPLLPVVLSGQGKPPIVGGAKKAVLTTPQFNVVTALLQAGEGGLNKDQLEVKSGHSDARGILKRLAGSDPDWRAVIHFPGRTGGRYRIG